MDGARRFARERWRNGHETDLRPPQADPVRFARGMSGFAPKASSRSGVGAVLLIAAVVALLAPPAALSFDPALEVKNFAKVSERQAYVTGTPEFQLRLQQQNVEDVGVLEQILLNDPERGPFNICSNRKNDAPATSVSTTGRRAATA